MTVITEVTNLVTHEKKTYSLMPTDAVVAAYHQEHGNFNTWTYDADRPKCVYSELHVACGGWVARRDPG